jgi:hypothetical protein
MIPLNECRHGYTYRIRSRNLTVGVFDSEKSGFVGIREKFGSRYLFTEFHRDTGAPYGTVSPNAEIEKCPLEDIRESFGTVCSECKVPVDWKPNDPKDGFGKWYHAAETPCKEATANGVSNVALYDYLKKVTDGADLDVFIEELPQTKPTEKYGPFRWHFFSAGHLLGITVKDLASQFKADVKDVEKWIDGDADLEPEFRKSVYDWYLEKAKAKKGS